MYISLLRTPAAEGSALTAISPSLAPDARSSIIIVAGGHQESQPLPLVPPPSQDTKRPRVEEPDIVYWCAL